MEKRCFKCNQVKSLNEFYKHSKMADGHLNKCKECNKIDVKKDYYRKSENKDWVLKERERSKEKYHRLGYCEKQKVWDEKRPWKKESILKNLNKKLKIKNGFECHHWSYNSEHFEDVFILDIKEHRKAHTFLFFDIKAKKFKTDKGIVLDTKTEHLNYLMTKNITIKNF